MFITSRSPTLALSRGVLRRVHRQTSLATTSTVRAFTRPSGTLRQDVQDVPAKQRALEETHNVAELDGLLNHIRAQSDPAHTQSIPLRPATLWAENLQRAAAADASADTPPTSTATASTARADGFYPPVPEPLPARRMHDSYCEIMLPFASEPALQDAYTNASGGLRTGKLMEHLDSLAGGVAYKHVYGAEVVEAVSGDFTRAPVYVVTAAVDRLDMLASLTPVRDIRLSGHVIHVGRSSMEIVVKMEALEAGKPDQTLMLGRFSMVCRSAVTHKASKVNPLVVTTPEEKALYAMGEAYKARRQSLSERSLGRVPPSSEEAAALHNFYLTYGREDSPPGEERVWMGDTVREVCQLMMPQERNMHGKIFGGYLMRLAYELGFANALLFTRGPVRFLSLDKISFQAPVAIGSILRLRSGIWHTDSTRRFPTLVHVGVEASVVDVKTGEERPTNDFRFTWCRDQGEPLKRKVVPRTYYEAMRWLEAQRALELNSLLGKQRE